MPTLFAYRVSGLVSILAVSLLCAACRPGVSHSPGVAAGVRHLFIDSPSLASPVNAQVWYPAVAGTSERPVMYTSTYWGHAAPDAAPQAQGHLPLIVLAHGWRGTRFDLSWIAEALARQGYVVASLDAPDADAKTFSNAQAPKIWFRAAMISQLIDTVVADPRLAPLFDVARVAVIGHSAGGSSAMVLAGAQIDPQRFAKNFPESAPVVAGDWADPRVAAIVGLNPGTGPVFTPAGLSQVHVPTLIMSGSGDHVAPEGRNAQLYATSIRGATWRRIADADHYTFMPMCSPWGLLRGFSTCRESVAGVDRAQVHATTLTQISAFLSKTFAQAAGAGHAPSAEVAALAHP